MSSCDPHVFAGYYVKFKWTCVGCGKDFDPPRSEPCDVCGSKGFYLVEDGAYTFDKEGKAIRLEQPKSRFGTFDRKHPHDHSSSIHVSQRHTQELQR